MYIYEQLKGELIAIEKLEHKVSEMDKQIDTLLEKINAAEESKKERSEKELKCFLCSFETFQKHAIFVGKNVKTKIN